MPSTRTEAVLQMQDFDGVGDPGYLMPVVTPENAPFMEQLAAGRLVVRRCSSCGAARYPAGPVCPHCHSADSTWDPVSGRGFVHAWIRYHRSFVPELEALTPYAVACVQLEDGPRIFGRLLDAYAEPWIGMPVQAVVERWPGGQHVHAFVAAAEDGERM
jgi:uncharacterized protein